MRVRSWLRRRVPPAVWVVVSLLISGNAAHAQTEQIEYFGLDALGSVRVIIDAQGNQLDRMDYGPFGENLKAAFKFPTEQFAQLSRDAESGQDYAQARSYAPSTGRFNRTDPLFAGLFAPQRWNRYAYAQNRPTGFIDPTGLEECPTIPGHEISSCSSIEADDPGASGSFFWNSYNEFLEWVDRHRPSGPFLDPGAVTGNGGSSAGGSSSSATDPFPLLQGCTVENGCMKMAGIPPSVAAAATATGAAAARFAQQASAGARDIAVYTGTRASQIVYSGITNNLLRRTTEHVNRFGVDRYLDGLTRLEARAIEQVLIQAGRAHGLPLDNIRNSISPANPLYTGAIAWGQSVLQSLGK